MREVALRGQSARALRTSNDKTWALESEHARMRVALEAITKMAVTPATMEANLIAAKRIAAKALRRGR